MGKMYCIIYLEAGRAGDEVPDHLAVPLCGVEPLEDAGEQIQLQAPDLTNGCSKRLSHKMNFQLNIMG